MIGNRARNYKAIPGCAATASGPYRLPRRAFKPAMVAFLPFTLISANCVTVRVFFVLSSATVTALRTSTLLLICWSFRQHGGLDQVLFLFFVSLVDRLPARIHEPGRDEDDQVALDVLVDIAAKQSAN
jgi:hypothetical protein